MCKVGHLVCPSVLSLTFFMHIIEFDFIKLIYYMTGRIEEKEKELPSTVSYLNQPNTGIKTLLQTTRMGWADHLFVVVFKICTNRTL